MREIKFRAWDDNGKDSRMYYPGDETNDGSALILNMHGDLLEARKLEEGNKTTDAAYNHAIYPARIGHSLTLMQYTGLKDKNGVEIYEGDILKRGKYRFPQLPVSFEAGCFFLAYQPLPKSELWRFAGKAEVIGNVHENPELLGQGSEETK